MQLWMKAGKVIKLALRALYVKNTKPAKSVKSTQYASRNTQYDYSGKSSRFSIIQIDFSLKIWYNTHLLDRSLT